MNVTAATPPLEEVRGPSAIGGGARRFFTLTWLLSVTDFKLSYFGTVFGYLWSLMRPLMLFAVLYVVFTKIARFGAGVPHYPVVLLTGVMLYTFFSEATSKSVGSVLMGENIVRKMQFPRLAIPLSVVLTGLFNLALNMVVVVVFILASGVEPRVTWLAFPLLIAGLVVLTAGVSVLLSALFVRFRDVAQIWGVLTLVIFYGSPILYPVERLPASLHFLLYINPLAPLLDGARRLLIDPSAPSTTAVTGGSPFAIIGPVVVVIVVCVAGFWVFARAAPRIAEEL